MKGTRINKIKNISSIKLDCDKDQYSIHPYEGKKRTGSKFILEAVFFSFIVVILFVAALFIPMILGLGDNGIIVTAFIATPILFITITIYIIINTKRLTKTITTYVCDRKNKILYTVLINPDRSFKRTIGGDYISVPDVDKAIKDSKNWDRIISDVLLTAKNINIIDFWYGGDTVKGYGYLELIKEDDNYLYVKSKLVNKKGTTYDNPKRKTLKIPKCIKDINTVRQIIY